MLKDKNIIKLRQDMDIFQHMDSMDYDTKFLGDRFLSIKTSTVIETIQELHEKIKGKELTEEQIFLNYAKDREEDFCKEFIKEFEPEENYKDLKEILKDGWIYELLEYFIQGENDISCLCEKNNCQFGTTGYSPWSYYISWKDMDSTFIRDLWEGWNWYIIALIKEGEVVDSIGGCYIPNVEELDEHVGSHFGIDKDDYYLVENDESHYIDKPKVEETTHKTYTYEIIKEKSRVQ